mgnify:CR=1 FL=1
MKLTIAISKRLNELMLEQNLTQYALFTKSGINQSVISRILNHKKSTITIHTILSLSQGLDIDLIEFFNSPLFKNENIED